MISNYIFNHLAQDSVDTTANAVLSAIQSRMDGDTLTAQDLPVYTYQSLKTILGDAAVSGNDANGNPLWAVNRIKSGRQVNKYAEINTPDEYPLVFITIQGVRKHTRRNDFGTIQAAGEITVIVNPQAAPSSLAWNALQRINSLFQTYSPSGFSTPVDLTAGVTAIKGLTGLHVEPGPITDSYWDYQRQIITVEARLIQ